VTRKVIKAHDKRGMFFSRISKKKPMTEVRRIEYWVRSNMSGSVASPMWAIVPTR
jgi:hypothetical protein